MSLFPVAPSLRVRLPGAVHVGRLCVAQILVDAKEAVELEWIDARLECVERWQIGAGDSRVWRRETLLSLGARVFAGGVLPAGSHVLPVRFDLPASLPPSLDVAGATIETLIHVQASIPWWRDARGSFVVPLRAAPIAIEPTPYRATNRARGTDVPRIEISLASRVVPARGVLSGAIAFFHHDARAIRGAVLSIAASARLFQRGGYEHRQSATAYTVALPADLPADGTPVPFRVRVPDGMVPTLASRTMAIEWELRVERPGTLRTATWLAIPIEVREAGDLGDDALGHEVAPIGDARLASMLEATAAGLGLAVEGSAMIGSVGGVGLRITRELRPDVGSALVADLELPRLGLGLLVEKTRWLPRLVSGDVEIGHSAFDAAHRVEARDPEQARAFLGPLADALAEGTLARLDDDHVRLERPDPTLDERSLASFADHVRAVASALDDALAHIVPPTAVEADLEAWRETARALDARLVVGDLSITGTLGESSVVIETRLDPRGPEHVVRARPAPPLPEALTLSVDEPSTGRATAGAAHGPAIAELLSAVPDTARGLVIAAGEVRVRLPLATEGARPRTDPLSALRVATLFAALGARLAPARGPFR